MHHCRGKDLKQNIKRKHFSRNTIFPGVFLLKRFLTVSIQKSQVIYDLGHGRYGLITHRVDHDLGAGSIFTIPIHRLSVI
jgi:hypothetical protein